MHWQWMALLLCAFGLLKEFKPIEPYLYRYQHTFLNISGDVLNSEVYPYWTYSYLLLSIPTMLLTDLLLYKPVLLLESLAYIGAWLTLLFGRSVLSQKFGQILFGLATATEIAYFAYAYVQIEDKKKYSIVTAWTRAALQLGKCLAYLLAQLILMLGWGDYQTLNWISLCSLSLTFFFALALPWVSWRQLAQQNQSQNAPIMKATTVSTLEKNHTLSAQPKATADDLTKDLLSPPQSYRQFAVQKMCSFYLQAKRAFSDGQVLRWSLWWAMATCGDLQVGNYIQLLWGEVQKDVHNSTNYNGFVEGIIPLLAACTLMGFERLRLDWARWGELALVGTALAECLSLLAMSQSGSLYWMYAGYAAIRILYQISITVAQLNIAIRIDTSASGFVFGLNMFVALVLQATLTFLVVDSQGPLQLGIRPQFVIYGAYQAFIAAIFLASQLLRTFKLSQIR